LILNRLVFDSRGSSVVISRSIFFGFYGRSKIYRGAIARLGKSMGDLEACCFSSFLLFCWSIIRFCCGGCGLIFSDYQSGGFILIIIFAFWV
jgi:hypothetical protein